MEGQGLDDNTPNISDVLEVIRKDAAMGPSVSPSCATPYIAIIEQPAAKETRFRYKCEGRSAGSIPGVSSTPDNKTHPKIQIKNCRGKAVVVVSCVTKSDPYRGHPHNLVGKDCKRGVCTVEVSSDDMSIQFPNLGIQCVKRKDIEEALREREEIRVDPFRKGFSHVNQPGSIDLNTVRLCFQAFLEDPERKKLLPLEPVVSDPIHDKKAVQELTICKLSQCSGSAGGGTDIILLCEKVVKEDIAVRFFEERDGHLFWEEYADFTPQQVHKQFAISFKTPKYATLQIEHPVKVYIELKRPSDGAASEPRQFTIYPIESEPDNLRTKRKKPNPQYSKAYNASPEVEPYKNVSLPPGLYSGGSVSGTGVAPLHRYSRSPSPNNSVGSPIPMGQLIVSHQMISPSQLQCSYAGPLTPPGPSYQQQTYRGVGQTYGDYNIAGPSMATFTNMDTLQTQVGHSTLSDVDINTDELKRITLAENIGEDKNSFNSFIPTDISI